MGRIFFQRLLALLFADDSQGEHVAEDGLFGVISHEQKATSVTNLNHK